MHLNSHKEYFFHFEIGKKYVIADDFFIIEVQGLSNRVLFYSNLQLSVQCLSLLNILVPTNEISPVRVKCFSNSDNMPLKWSRHSAIEGL